MEYIFIFFALFCGFVIYRTGFKDGQKVASGAKIGNLMPKRKKQTSEEERLNRGMENILNYANRKMKGDEGK